MVAEAEAMRVAPVDETTKVGANVSEKGGSKKKIAIIGVALVAAAVGAKFFVLKPAPAPVHDAAPAEGEVIDVGTMVVNLDDTFAKVGLAMVASEGANVEEVATKVALLKDAAITQIAAFSPDELKTPKGQDRLREELTKAVGEIYHEGEVVRVVLTELVVQ